MKLRSAAGTAALNVAISLMLLVAGVGGGVALGMLKGPSVAAAAVPSTAGQVTGFIPTEQPHLMASLTVEEAPPVPAPVRRTVRRVVTSSGTGKASLAAGSGALSTGSPAVPGPGIGSPNCARLDDAKINWLLRLAAKAKASNPDQADVAARVEQQLTAAFGKNMCAEEAQIYVGQMCAEAGTKRFMDAMVKELPFFVRPLVGDPCTQDLVAAAEKWLPST